MNAQPIGKTLKGLWLHGSSGRMGREIQKALLDQKASPLRLLGGSAETFEGELFLQGKPVDSDTLATMLARPETDLILDFTTEAGNALLLEAFEAADLERKAVLIGTTGLPESQLARWKKVAAAKKLALLIAPNTSVGVLMTVKAALTAAGVLSGLGFDIEIVETHHRHKRDAPSGTARFMASTLCDAIKGLETVTDRVGARKPGEIGIHAVRGGAVFGEHEIRIIGESEEVTISHRAFSRALFASGALVLGAWIVRQKPGIYGLMDVSVDDL